MQDYENIINIFVVDCNESSATIFTDVCRMLKGVDVYEFARYPDALKFAASSPPGIVIVNCDSSVKTEAIETIRKFSAAPLPPMVIAAGPSYDLELEKLTAVSGALNYLPMPINKDTFFYLIKNIVDISKHKNIQKNSAPRDLCPLAIKDACYFKIVSVKSYHDIILMNKNIAALPVIIKNTGSLVYIRFLSFLYDFFIKIFLGDRVFFAGVFVDEKRIIIEFPLSEDITGVMKSTVFYSIAEKYYFHDGDFGGFNMNFETECHKEHGNVCKDIFSGFFEADNEPKFANLYADKDNILKNLSQRVNHYASYCPIFEYVAEFIAERASVLDFESKSGELEGLFCGLDEIIADLSAKSDSNETIHRRVSEDTLIYTLTKIMFSLSV